MEAEKVLGEVGVKDNQVAEVALDAAHLDVRRNGKVNLSLRREQTLLSRLVQAWTSVLAIRLLPLKW